MPVIDASSSEFDRARIANCDICIIGTGPAGSTLASELSESNLKIVVLESGGFERSAHADALNVVENAGGAREPDQWEVRNRIVGGSSHTWGGRCAPFDEIDLEDRPWVPNSGWPFSIEDLDPFLNRSKTHLGLVVGNGFNDHRFWDIIGRDDISPAYNQRLLLPFFWQFSRDPKEQYPYEHLRFGRHLQSRSGRNVTLAINATAIRIEPKSLQQSDENVVFCSPDGRAYSLSAKSIVLCAGAIENARLLLASTNVSSLGLGNQNDLVGRYLMDHPRGAVGTFDIQDAKTLRKWLGRFNFSGRLFRAGLRLSPEIQKAEGLLNCAAWLGETVSRDDPWEICKRVIQGKAHIPGDVFALARNSSFMIGGFHDYVVGGNGIPRKLSALTLDCMCEQTPNPDSRVTLAEQTDRFGVPIPRIDWRTDPSESNTMRRMAELVRDELKRTSSGSIKLADWIEDQSMPPPHFLDVGHPTGATRMHVNPTKGVVDPNGQVHEIEGLFVAGSSVFPTAGHCNPTQMIVALAVRLADHLKARHRSLAAHPQPLAKTVEGKNRVLVTGATGRIGRVVVQDLLSRGYSVRALSTTPARDNSSSSGQLEWRTVDFLSDVDFDALVDGCQSVLHIAAEIGLEGRMEEVNVTATQRLVDASEKANVKAFCYTSSVSVYGSSRQRIMSEDAPVLTTDKDVPGEYWALGYVRTYGRTKLKGEYAIRKSAKKVRYTILRPTVVVNAAQLVEIREWSLQKRAFAAHRHAHHIYVGDVSDAMIWAMERSLKDAEEPGKVETFNLSEDDFAEPTHAAFMRKAFLASGDRRFKVPTVPWAVDWLYNFIRFGRRSLRNPLWLMHFPNDRLRSAGYQLRFGMAQAQSFALDLLREEAVDRAPAEKR